MRKYLQITIVMSVFFILVILKNSRVDETPQPIIANIQTLPSNQNNLQPNTANSTVSNNPTSSSNNNSPATSNQQPAIYIPSATPQPTVQQNSGQYKNGTYTGSVEDAYYGNVQVQVNISGGRITDVTFLQYPNDNGTSRFINSQAMPYLKDEAIQAQNANVNIVSGASDTSMAFQQSLANALSQAH
ncbi:FMN-binding protein [Patescibacteria group bacterium]|nr:FMN-binding protein [Patescibacteria group bacterium]